MSLIWVEYCSLETPAISAAPYAHQWQTKPNTLGLNVNSELIPLQFLFQYSRLCRLSVLYRMIYFFNRLNPPEAEQTGKPKYSENFEHRHKLQKPLDKKMENRIKCKACNGALQLERA